MNIKEWKKSLKFEGKFEWYNKTRKFQKSLQHNTDPAAIVIHHLRDTEEQRKYNDEHYELWGHNLDGSFEYGKYVIFVTKEQHTEIHKCSEETCKKMSDSRMGHVVTEETRARISTSNMGHRVSEETRKKISDTQTGKVVSEETRKKISISCKGHIPPNKNVPHSYETRKKISENTRAAMTDEVRKKCSDAHIGIRPSDETRKKMSESAKRRSDYNFCKKMSTLQSERMTEEYKKHLGEKMRSIMHRKKELYEEYKNSGGTLLWNEFQTYIKEHNLIS